MKYTEGTVISGTLRSQDLAPVFASTLIALTPESERDESSRRVSEYVDAILDQPDSDVAHELLDAMSDEITALLPEGLRFGPHEGDPADFGIWDEVME